MEYCQHIVGPPGTGKTETLMRIIENVISRGIEPRRIGFCSFTRAAIREAQDRALNTFHLTRNDLPYFGTIHSLCYRYLGLNRNSVFHGKHWRTFCKALNLPYTENNSDIDFALDEPWEPMGKEEGDILRAWYDWARNNCLPLEEAARRYESGTEVFWNVSRASWFAREVEEYKKTNHLVDFVDMLLLVQKDEWVPDIDVLILDEAQDLSPLQQKIFLQWAREAREVYLGYDEDQTIYSFQGANPDWLINFPGERIFLERSYRVPRRPALLAQKLISRNKNRYQKTWVPREAEGEIYYDVYFDELLPKVAGGEETWFLLARNNIYLQNYTQKLNENGIPYLNLRGSSPLSKVPTSIIAALRLANNLSITIEELNALSKDIPTDPYWGWGAKKRIERTTRQFPELEIQPKELPNYGALKPLLACLSNVETCLQPIKRLEGNKAYYLAVFKNYGYEGLRKRPKVVLGSFHSVKGKQADNVVLLPNLTRKTNEGYTQDPEAERRVWYVAATRTKNRLYLLAPLMRGGACFDEW